MEIGTRVWATCEKQVWAPAVVVETLAASSTVKVQLESGEIVTRKYLSEDEEEITQDANGSDADDDRRRNEIRIRNKPTDMAALAWLTGLEHLHEPALLHALSERFALDHIYTSIGEILVAVNPLKDLPLYSQQAIDLYKNAMQADALAAVNGDHEPANGLAATPPHVFAIAGKAFGGLLSAKQRNQSILVSGESGSGKTETTKFLMHFLTSVGRDQSRNFGDDIAAVSAAAQESVEIGKRILQTNPILESFGNAQTIRNDNSSRFGKFIKIQFGAHNEIIGAEIASYLLEKVRLIHQSPEERNFHIFYELLEGGDAELLASLGLTRGAKYELLNAYGSPTFARRNGAGTQYAKRYVETIEAFKDTGVGEDETRMIFQILAALLHLGNVNFCVEIHGDNASTREEGAAIAADSRAHLEKCAELLGLSTSDLETLLTSRAIKAGAETVFMKLTVDQSKDVCRSLAKAIYGRLFSWLVRRLSDGINYCDADDSGPDENIKTIGILDIFGFENLRQNGFEQLCINYANERLQAQFNEFVFIKEQDVYTHEGIDWRSIPFPSNAACLTLFDDKMNGLFSLLDQECLMPKGSDQALGTKFYRYHGGEPSAESFRQPQTSQKYGLPLLVSSFGRYLQPPAVKEKEIGSPQKGSRFSASKMDRVKHQFVVHHFAGRVSYRIEQFVEKNQDLLPADASKLLSSSKNAIVNAIGDVDVVDQWSENNGVGRRRFSLLRSPSVSSQFRSQLDQLIDEIGQTEAHYIRCLKPNEVKRAGVFDRARMVEQLRSVGVLEALRIARAGYSVRLTHATFIEQFSGFHHMSRAKMLESSPKARCEDLTSILMDEVQKERRLSKSFSFREKDASVQQLDVQVGRTMVFCKKTTFNRFSRLRAKLRERAAIVLQRHYRGYRRRQYFRLLREFVSRVQSIVRGFITRRRFAEMKRLRAENAAWTIQRSWRKWLRNYNARKERSAHIIQRTWKTWLKSYCARKEKSAFVIQRCWKLWLKNCQLRKERSACIIQRNWTAWLRREREADEIAQKYHLQRVFAHLRHGCTLSKQHAQKMKEQAPTTIKITVAKSSLPVIEQKRLSKNDMESIDAISCASVNGDDSSSDSAALEKPVRQASISIRRAPEKRKSLKKKKRKDTKLQERNSQLENEIVRLQKMLVQTKSQSSRKLSSRRSNFGSAIAENESQELPPRWHSGRRSLSMDAADFSDDPDEEGDDEVSLLPPRRAHTVLPGRQEDTVAHLARRIEELDAKCKFLEQVVARKSYDEGARGRVAYNQTPLGQQSYTSYLDGHDNVSEHSEDPPLSDGGSSVDGIIHSIQQQMDVLRQSLATKEEESRRDGHSMSISSSRQTRSSSAASTASYGMNTRPIRTSSASSMTSYQGGVTRPTRSSSMASSACYSGTFIALYLSRIVCCILCLINVILFPFSW